MGIRIGEVFLFEAFFIILGYLRKIIYVWEVSKDKELYNLYKMK